MLSGQPFTSETSSESDHLPALKGVHSVHLFRHAQLFVSPWTAAHQASLPITDARGLFKPTPIESVTPSTHAHRVGDAINSRPPSR